MLSSMAARAAMGSWPIIRLSSASAPAPTPNMKRPRVMWSSWMALSSNSFGWW